MYLIVSALLGFFAVAFGAFAEHGLKPVISNQDFNLIAIAMNYHQYHATVLLLLALGFFMSPKLNSSKVLRFSALAFTLGIFLFSFTIYLSVLLNISNIRMLTPFGGSSLMLGWILLAIFGFQTFKSQAINKEK